MQTIKPVDVRIIITEAANIAEAASIRPAQVLRDALTVVNDNMPFRVELITDELAGATIHFTEGADYDEVMESIERGLEVFSEGLFD